MSNNQSGTQVNNSNNLDQQVIYEYFLQNSEPCFYVRIPNIIDILTYDFINPKTGQTESKRLSVYAKELYRIIKNIAGDHGACWKNRDELAEICNMSAGTISKAKEELQQKFHQLDDNPLIQITYHQKTNIKDGSIGCKSWYHKCMIIDIWKFNNAYFRTADYLKKQGKSYQQASSPHDEAGGASSPHDIAPQGASSPGDTNKNNTNNNPMSIEQQPTAYADSVVFEKERLRLFGCSKQEKTYRYLLSVGCEESLCFAIVQKYSVQDIVSANDYIREQEKKPGFIFKKPKWAYFQDILNKKYWIKK